VCVTFSMFLLNYATFTYNCRWRLRDFTESQTHTDTHIPTGSWWINSSNGAFRSGSQQKKRWPEGSSHPILMTPNESDLWLYWSMWSHWIFRIWPKNARSFSELSKFILNVYSKVDRQYIRLVSHKLGAWFVLIEILSKLKRKGQTCELFQNFWSAQSNLDIIWKLLRKTWSGPVELEVFTSLTLLKFDGPL